MVARPVARMSVWLPRAGDDAGRGAEVVAGDDEEIGDVDGEAARRRRGMGQRHVVAGGEVERAAGDPAGAAARSP